MTELSQTPAALGFRMPAEWELQESVWLSWPHNRETWPGAFDHIPKVFAEIVKHISESQLVRINVENDSMADQARRLLIERGAVIENVRFHFNPTNDCWIRDYGPIYVVRDVGGKRERAITNWSYNSWGGKYPPYDLDNSIPDKIAEELRERTFNTEMVLEGGSIDVNGSGTLLTTTSCLLNKNRNSQLSKDEIENKLRSFLGVSKVLWLGAGILGDDTDGHIDDITRFVAPNVIVTALEEDFSDENYLPLKQNLKLLQAMTDQSGQPFEIVTLPMPRAVHYEENRLPTSYANFLITNSFVLVPTYRCDRDQPALSILQEQFPEREIIGIDCTDLVWGLGAIHCISQQQPLSGVDST